MNSKHYHMIIIGSGLIGCITAIALAQKTSDPILLIDAKKTQLLEKNNLDTRTLALNYASCQYLTELAIWTQLAPYACPMQSIHISEKDAFGSCLFEAKEVNFDYLGQVIEIADLQREMLNALSHYSNITLWDETQVTQAKMHTEGVQLVLSRQAETLDISSDYLILADGTDSQLRSQFGINIEQHNYHQQALVAIAQLPTQHHHTAYERFIGEDILAILPMTHNRIGTVLTHPDSETRRLLEMDDQSYMVYLESLLGFRLGRFSGIGPRRHYPLMLSIADRFIQNRVILLGNTAHTLNPIGAQGLNLGLAGVKDFVHTFTAHQNLQEFEARQQERVAQLKKFTNQTLSIFASPHFTTRLARRTALVGLDFLPMIKHKFIRQMMGL